MDRRRPRRMIVQHYIGGSRNLAWDRSGLVALPIDGEGYGKVPLSAGLQPVSSRRISAKNVTSTAPAK